MSPSESILKDGGKTVWQRTRLLTYRIFIKLLAIHYKSYAFSHTIIEDDIKVVHEFRDHEFEKELSSLGLCKTGKTLTDNHFSLSAYGLHYASIWFEFVDKLIVYSENQEISISREGKDSLLNYPKKTTMNYSDKQSAIQRILLESNSREYVSAVGNKKEAEIIDIPKKKNKAMEIDDSF